jgi:hypothetical protein
MREFNVLREGTCVLSGRPQSRMSDDCRKGVRNRIWSIVVEAVLFTSFVFIIAKRVDFVETSPRFFGLRQLALNTPVCRWKFLAFQHLNPSVVVTRQFSWEHSLTSNKTIIASCVPPILEKVFSSRSKLYIGTCRVTCLQYLGLVDFCGRNLPEPLFWMQVKYFVASNFVTDTEVRMV